MFSLPRPIEDLDVIFASCVAQTRDVDLKSRLVAETDRLLERAGVYLNAAIAEELYLVQEQDPIAATVDELMSIYSRVIVKGRGRSLYDRLIRAARYRRCPLCCQRDAQTLDHYLPESIYPEFSVLPVNLVPTCFSCNKTKHAHVPENYAEQTFLPYFDEWGNHTFLRSSVNVTDRVDVEFFVQRPAEFSEQRFERVTSHFGRFELANLYAGHAAVELVQAKQIFRSAFADGAAALRAELIRIFQSRSQPFRNAWEPALYSALAECEEFYSGGFELIEE